jgi:hypothetical protein
MNVREVFEVLLIQRNFIGAIYWLYGSSQLGWRRLDRDLFRNCLELSDFCLLLYLGFHGID